MILWCIGSGCDFVVGWGSLYIFTGWGLIGGLSHHIYFIFYFFRIGNQYDVVNPYDWTYSTEYKGTLMGSKSIVVSMFMHKLV